jgi:hypothetical protein
MEENAAPAKFDLTRKARWAATKENTPMQLAALLGLPTGVCDEHKTARWICQYLEHDPRIELARLT